jgi:hypothetical protein
VPPVKTAADAVVAAGAVVAAVSDGEITLSEGEAMSKILDAHVRTLEARDFEERLAALEAKEGSK